MNTITLNQKQTRIFWSDIVFNKQVTIHSIDKYIYDTYNITKRRWTTHRTLELTFEDEKYISLFLVRWS